MLFESSSQQQKTLEGIRHTNRHGNENETSTQPISVQYPTDPWTSCALGRTICPRPCTPHAAAQLQPYTPYAYGAQRTLRHEYSWSTGSGSLWLWLRCRPYKLCSDEQPTKAAWWPWPFDLESGVRVTCDVGYLCANFSLPRPLFSS